MGFFSKLFVVFSAALGLFVSGLDLLERFDVDVNAWLRGVPPVIAMMPETYGDWIDRFAADGLAEPEAARLQARNSEPDGFTTLQARHTAPPNALAMWISGGVAALMLLVLSLMSGQLFRRR